ncbi:sialate O-acetylesterase [Thioclava kandeliae]|uniref:Sialate O-acetylesterase n=1 Tax=Thioclava kandeliae TaxID=3070818 RepID=A0ABV1SFC0_9RHOB
MGAGGPVLLVSTSPVALSAGAAFTVTVRLTGLTGDQTAPASLSSFNVSVGATTVSTTLAASGGGVWTYTGTAPASESDATAAITASATVSGDTISAAAARAVIGTGADAGAGDGDTGGGEVTPEPAGETHVFLLAGQSNMVGISGDDGGADYPVGVMQFARDGGPAGAADGALVQAADPLDHQHVVEGSISLARQFCIEYQAANPDVTIVLVPAAYGGTGLYPRNWRKGDTRYEWAVARANLCMTNNPDFIFKGILWHQGEEDVYKGSTDDNYRTQIQTMFANMRTDIVAADETTPIVAGEIADVSYSTYQQAAGIKAVISKLYSQIPYLAVAETGALATSGDNIHFTGESLRTMGSLYYAKWAEAQAAAVSQSGAVRNLGVVIGDGQATVHWLYPEDQGGATIDSYRVEYSSDGGSSWTTFSSTKWMSRVVTGLVNDTAYTFRVTPVTAFGDGVSVTATGTPVAGAVNAEVESVGHWLLGSDNTSRVGLSGGELYQYSATEWADSAGYMTSPTTGASGLLTHLDDPKDVTLAAVIRIPADDLQSCILGTLRDTSDEGGTLICNDTTNGYLGLIRAPYVSNYYVQQAYTAGEWFFIALSSNYDASTVEGFKSSAGGSATRSVAGRRIASPYKKIAVGNVFFNASTGGAIDMAELMVFDRAMTSAEMAEVYARSQSRLAARGITVA